MICFIAGRCVGDASTGCCTASGVVRFVAGAGELLPVAVLKESTDNTNTQAAVVAGLVVMFRPRHDSSRLFFHNINWTSGNIFAVHIKKEGAFAPSFSYSLVAGLFDTCLEGRIVIPLDLKACVIQSDRFAITLDVD